MRAFIEEDIIQRARQRQEQRQAEVRPSGKQARAGKAEIKVEGSAGGVLIFEMFPVSDLKLTPEVNLP